MQAALTKNGTWSINNSDLLASAVPMAEGTHYRLPEDLGRGHSNVFRLDSDLSYIETNYSPRRDLAVLSRMEHREPRMVVTLGLQGRSRFVPTRGDEVEFKAGYTSITTFNSSEGARQYQGNETVRQLRFTMTRNWLDRYFGERAFADYFDDAATRLVCHRPISAAGLAAAQALLHNDVADQVRPLFRQAQALAILASELGQLLTPTPKLSVPFNERDKAMACRAREILLAEFQEPPSVDALARRVGTNQFKLKQLFHHYFDNTPYGLLLEFRMKQAYRLLQTGQCSIAIAAEAVGYSHASNFSTAFSKYFGFPPKSLTRRN